MGSALRGLSLQLQRVDGFRGMQQHHTLDASCTNEPVVVQIVMRVVPGHRVARVGPNYAPCMHGLVTTCILYGIELRGCTHVEGVNPSLPVAPDSDEQAQSMCITSVTEQDKSGEKRRGTGSTTQRRRT
jgi:hypothetical protein